MEGDLLAAARTGDERAFQALIDPRRAELHAHCYRMLGSVADADDALQEALVRAWRGLPRFEGRSSLRTWLFRIATNACLDARQRRTRRVLPVAFGPAGGDAGRDPDEEWLEPYPVPPDLIGARSTPEARYDQLESVELAFVAAIQHLAPNERAVLLLCEVLGFSARETAEQLETSVGAVTSTLQRARQRLDGRLPAHRQQEAQRALGPTAVQALVARYMDAMERGDVEALVALLTDDATWSMPPEPAWYRGRDEIVTFLKEGPMRLRWRHRPTSVNGQPAIGCYAWDDEAGAYLASALDVLDLDGDRIGTVTSFLGPAPVERTGLPARLPDPDPG